MGDGVERQLHPNPAGDNNSGQRMIQRAIVDALEEGEILLWHM